jgi:hypothetical protein
MHEPEQHQRPQGMLPGRERRRSAVERGLVRIIATGGIVGIAAILGAVLVNQDVAGWIVGLAVGLTSVILAALLWSSRQRVRRVAHLGRHDRQIDAEQRPGRRQRARSPTFVPRAASRWSREGPRPDAWVVERVDSPFPPVRPMCVTMFHAGRGAAVVGSDWLGAHSSSACSCVGWTRGAGRQPDQEATDYDRSGDRQTRGQVRRPAESLRNA